MRRDLSRRQFLAHSAGIAGVSMGLGPRRAEGAPSLGLGVIGLGDRGRELLRAFSRLQAGGAAAEISQGFRLAAVCDVDPRRLKRVIEAEREGAAGERPGGGEGRSGEPGAPRRGDSRGRDASARGVKGFTKYRSLLDAPDVDAVLIATPVDLHAPQVLAALAAGKHVYCEKPLANDLADCRGLLAAATAAEEAGQVFQIGFQRRFSPRYRRSIEYLRSGEAGRVLFVRAQWHATSPGPPSKPWLFRRERSGDIVLEQASHQFDVFNWVLGGPPVKACGFGGAHLAAGAPAGRDTLDHYGAVLEYEGGAKVHMSHVTFAPPDRRFCGVRELVFGERMGVDLAGAVAWNAAGKTIDLGAAKGNDTELAVRAFLESVWSGRPSAAGARVAYDAAVAALLCRRAVDEGGTVRRRELEGV